MGSRSNHEISGIQDWHDLEEVQCSPAYKNEFEMNFSVTKSSIIALYESQLNQLRTNPETERNVHVVHNYTQGCVIEDQPTILERFRFTDGADSSNHFIKAILAQYKRRQWDR